MHRFYVPDLGAPGGIAVLPRAEAAHLARVLRLRPGDRVHVFDGRGRACAATVDTVKPEVRVRVGTPVTAAPEAAVRLTLAPALLKGDAFDAVVREATMLGAAAVQPVVSARVDVARTVLHRRLDRWTRVALASVKQCGRAVLPIIEPPRDLSEVLEGPFDGLKVMLVEPLAGASAHTLADLGRQPAPSAATLLVGPEGGWTGEEIRAAEAAGWILLTLGGRTLRAEAAPIVAIAALWAVWGEL